MDTPVTFGEWLRMRRRSLDLTQEELARRIGVSVTLIRKIESGERRPSRQVAGLLGQCLELPAEDFERFVKIARGQLSIDGLLKLQPAAPRPLVQPSQPTIQAAHRPAGFLPAPTTPLIGREHELYETLQLVQNPQCRLLTLVGPGGVGKTRLAMQVSIEAASRLRREFPGGVFFVPLASVSSVELLVPAIADVLGIAFYGSEDHSQQLFHFLRDKALLLVLDNLEHFLASPTSDLNSEDITLLSDLLQSAPRVKILTNSRERLNLLGEWVLELQGLPVPAASLSSSLTESELCEYSSISLFLQSARRSAPDFALTEGNKGDIARICQLLDGLPLAIELAAPLVRLMTCREILQEIERNLDFLSAAARGIPSRHRSLRATFDYSWNLLAEDERSTLERLGVFWGGFTRQAAEFVAEGNLPVITALVDKSLLRRSGEGRYDLHELIRQYVVAHLLEDPQEHKASLERHSHYYLGWLHSQETFLKGEKQADSVASISQEIENVRQALNWAALHREAGPLGKIIPALYWFYDIRNWFQEAIVLFQQLGEALRPEAECSASLEPAQAAVLGHTLASQGYFCLRYGRFEQAEALLEESISWLRPLDSHLPTVQIALADALGHSGLLAHYRGDYPLAEKLWMESLSIRQARGDAWGCSTCLLHLGLIARNQGECAEARQLMREGLSILMEIGDPFGAVRILAFLSATANACGDHQEAQKLAEESLERARAIRDQWGVAFATTELGIAAYAQGDYETAQDLFQMSYTTFDEIGDRWNAAEARLGLGNVAIDLQALAEARIDYQEALQITTQASILPLSLEAMVGIADVYFRLGQSRLPLELLENILQHPALSMRAADRAGKLLAQLEAQMKPDELEAVRGRIRPFDEMLKELLV